MGCLDRSSAATSKAYMSSSPFVTASSLTRSTLSCLAATDEVDEERRSSLPLSVMLVAGLK